MATEQSIIDRLFRDYGHPDFQSRDFHGYRAVSRADRMFLSMRVLEAEVSNGGFAQFLWNVFFHWRSITDDCAFGYTCIGAEAQAAAIPEVIRLLSAHEATCGEYLARSITMKDFSEFQAWYAVGERAMDASVDALFYPSDTINTLKQSWLSSHATGNA